MLEINDVVLYVVGILVQVVEKGFHTHTLEHLWKVGLQLSTVSNLYKLLPLSTVECTW